MNILICCLSYSAKPSHLASNNFSSSSSSPLATLFALRPLSSTSSPLATSLPLHPLSSTSSSPLATLLLLHPLNSTSSPPATSLPLRSTSTFTPSQFHNLYSLSAPLHPLLPTSQFHFILSSCNFAWYISDDMELKVEKNEKCPSLQANTLQATSVDNCSPAAPPPVKILRTGSHLKLVLC